MNTRKAKIFILIRKLGNIPSPLQNCICWTQKAKSLKGVDLSICWNLIRQVIFFRKRKQTKKKKEI